MRIHDLPDGTLVADGWDDCLVGYGWRLNTPIAIYDRDAMVRVMMERDGATEEEADEYISFNIEGAYVGGGTPLVVRLDRPGGDVAAATGPDAPGRYVLPSQMPDV